MPLNPSYAFKPKSISVIADIPNKNTDYKSLKIAEDKRPATDF